MGLHLNQGDDELVENHEINVTPFIDVMLVLLIIFMVAAPLATVDIKVDLPASSAKPAPRPEKPVFLSVKADQRLFLGEEEVKAVVTRGLAGHDRVQIHALALRAVDTTQVDTELLVEEDPNIIVTCEIEGLACPGYITEGRGNRVREVVVVAISGIPQQLVIDREESGIAVLLIS